MQIDQKCRNAEMQYAEYAICIVIRLFKIHWRKNGGGEPLVWREVKERRMERERNDAKSHDSRQKGNNL